MYIVIELQTSKDNKVAILVTSFDNINDAKSKYHTILSSAAISNIYKHAAVILDDNGSLIARECYIHSEKDD